MSYPGRGNFHYFYCVSTFSECNRGDGQYVQSHGLSMVRTTCQFLSLKCDLGKALRLGRWAA